MIPVKVEGTLDELRALFGDAKRTGVAVVETVEEVKQTAKKTKRKLSEWQRYVRNKSNHIKYKSGPRKGRLDLGAMAKKFRRRKK